jgi:hypothetical protein
MAMIDNILEMYDLSTQWDKSEGMGWYPYARQECFDLAKRHEVDPRRVVWSVAALSPMLKWERNIAAAGAVLRGAAKFQGVFSSNIEKAWHILWDTSDWERWLAGNKVNCFARNIWGETDTVTIDTWAWRIWAKSDLFAAPPNLEKLYWDIAADYREAARQVGLEARQLQAITWVTIRRIANSRNVWGQLSLDM